MLLALGENGGEREGEGTVRRGMRGGTVGSNVVRGWRPVCYSLYRCNHYSTTITISTGVAKGESLKSDME